MESVSCYTITHHLCAIKMLRSRQKNTVTLTKTIEKTAVVRILQQIHKNYICSADASFYQRCPVNGSDSWQLKRYMISCFCYTVLLELHSKTWQFKGNLYFGLGSLGSYSAAAQHSISQWQRNANEVTNSNSEVSSLQIFSVLWLCLWVGLALNMVLSYNNI